MTKPNVAIKKEADKVRVLERRKLVAQLYCEGKSQFEISKVVGVSQPMISTDLVVIRKAWLATAVLDWDDIKARELAKLDLIEERMWEAYHRSVGKEKVTTANVKRELRDCLSSSLSDIGKEDNQVIGGRGKHRGRKRKLSTMDEAERIEATVQQVMTTVEERMESKEYDRAGDAAYMDRILDCIKLRCKILGFLDEKNNVTNNLQVNMINWDEIAKAKTELDNDDNDPVEMRIKQLSAAPTMDGQDIPNGLNTSPPLHATNSVEDAIVDKE